MAKEKGCCWKPNSKCERILFILLILFIVTSIFLIIGLILKSSSQDKVCTSKSCIEAAYEMFTNMDPNADPCVDFYQFACGGFANTTNELQHSSISKFEATMVKNLEQLRKIIIQPWKTGEPTYYKLVKDLHSSCLNESKIEQLADSPLRTILEEVGGWPVIEGSDWKENDFDWRQTLVQFRSMGTNFNLFFYFDVRENLLNSKEYVLSIGEPSTVLPIEYYKKNKYREGYLQLMIDIAVLLGADKTRAEREMKLVLDMETKISEFLMPLEERRNVTKFYNEFIVDDLQKITSQISWVDFLNSMKFPMVISKHDRIFVTVPNTLKQLSALLEKTNKRIISNYMLWRVVLGHCQLLHKALKNLCAKFYEKFLGSVPFATRKYYCIATVFSALRLATGAIYAKKLFDPESKPMATDLVLNVKEVLFHSLSSTKWMDPETLAKAMDKLETMREYVAYPEELLDDSIVNNFYKSLVISEDEYFKNLSNLSKFVTDFYFSLLNKRVDETNWIQFAGSATVNAQNFFSANRIQIYAGILGGSFFNPHWPKYLNYGGIGTIIGHEFVHGFDDIGKQFDKYGNLNNWWANETAMKFREKADMVVRQYTSFVVPSVNMTVNGINVQGEAISDIEGFNLAYKAYEKWEKKNEKEPGLPGLSLNSKQLFWLKAANIWCSNRPDESLILQILNGVHPPSQYRIIGPVTNSKYFGKDFNCPVGSPMNPYEKISFCYYFNTAIDVNSGSNPMTVDIDRNKFLLMVKKIYWVNL